MALTKCPICGHQAYGQDLRCGKCGADFHDPDVRALMDQAPDLNGDALLAGVETLSASKVLSVSAEGLDNGSALTRLALIGAGLFGVGFFIPLAIDYEHYRFAWAVEGASLGLWFPAAACAIGLVLSALHAAPRLPRSIVLALGGFAGLLLTPSLGKFAATTSHALPLYTLAIALGAAAATQRLYAPHSKRARYGLIGASALMFAGLLIPVSEATSVVPAEVRFLLGDLEGGGTPLKLLWAGASRQPLTYLIGNFALAALLVLPAAAAVAHIKAGVWDRGGQALRPMTWLLILFPALLLGLQTFNLMGWEVRWVVYDGFTVPGESFAQAGMTGRAKMMVITAASSLWAVFGTVGAYRTVWGADDDALAKKAAAGH